MKTRTHRGQAVHQVVVHGREFTVLRFRACTSTSAPRSHVNANIRSLESRMNGMCPRAFHSSYSLLYEVLELWYPTTRDFKSARCIGESAIMCNPNASR